MSETAAVEPGQSGLLDGVSVTDDKQEPNPQQVAIDHKPADPAAAPTGPTERPDWMPENFWKDGNPDYEGLAKSWRDLRGKISKGAHNAPADGKYDLSSFGDATDNPMANTLSGWAKENGLSQAQFDDLVGQLQTQAKEIMGNDMIDPAAELQKLGPNGRAMVDGMVDWARGLVNKGVWGAEDFEEFKIMGGTARGLNALVKIREAYEGRVPIESAPIDGMPSKEELYAMVGDPKYKTDPVYRQKVERLFNQVMGQ